MEEDLFNHFDQRVSILEENVEVLIGLFNHVSKEMHELKIQAATLQMNPCGVQPPTPFLT